MKNLLFLLMILVSSRAAAFCTKTCRTRGNTTTCVIVCTDGQVLTCETSCRGSVCQEFCY